MGQAFQPASSKRQAGKPAPRGATQSVAGGAFPRGAWERGFRRGGFSLAELLVVVGLVAVFAALIPPSVQWARERARQTRCRDQMRQLGVALQSYHDTHGRLPPGTVWPTFQYDNPRATYLPHLFPHMGLGDLARQIDWQVNGTLWCRGNNPDAVATAIPQLLCPSDGLGGRTKLNRYCGTHALTNYMAFFGERMAEVASGQAAFGANRGARWDEITDGLGQTMVMGEYLTGTPDDLRGGLWGDEAGMSLLFYGLTPNSREPDLFYPNPVLCDPLNPETNNPALNLPCGLGDGYLADTAASRSRHPGGVYVLLADGQVRFVSERIDVATWRRMGTIAEEGD